MRELFALLISLFALYTCSSGSSYAYPFQDPTLPIPQRVSNLVSLLTLEEKVLQLAANMSSGGGVPAISRLNISAFNWATECLRGDVGIEATAFVQAIALAATFDASLVNTVGKATADEVRSLFNLWRSQNSTGATHHGVNCWSPVINIAIAPLWGRAQETYGEDVELTSRIGVAYLSGLQRGSLQMENAPEVTATAKHASAHHGPENIPVSRMSFNAIVSERDWHTTYLPAFKAAVDAGVSGIMCSYNAINGIPACANAEQMTDILRNEWGYEGLVTSDCGAVWFIQAEHHYVQTLEEAAAVALNAGCDMECTCCGGTAAFPLLVNATHDGLVNESRIDQALSRLMTLRMKLGLFDPLGYNPYDAFDPAQIVNSPAHRGIAYMAALESTVLLKNSNNALPLRLHTNDTLCVIGPNANNSNNLLGDYNPVPDPSWIVTPLQGIQNYLSTYGPANVNVFYDIGCQDGVPCTNYTQNLDSLVKAAGCSSAVVILGLNTQIEAEGNDRSTMALPGNQEKVFSLVKSTGVKVVVVFVHGGSLAVPNLVPLSDAMLTIFYPGEQGGAVADVLFGRYSPAGRLPQTWYNADSDLPSITNYSLNAAPNGWSYRYFTGQPLFGFGFGLSFVAFEYSNLSASPALAQLRPCQSLSISLLVTNLDLSMASDEVSQIYMQTFNASVPLPQLQLVDFARSLQIQPGESRALQFVLPPESFSVLRDPDFLPQIEPGYRKLWIGSAQPGAGLPGLSLTVQIVGNTTLLSTC